MKNFFRTFLIIAYSIIAITVTILLLSYNNYKCSVIGGYTLYLLQDDIADTYQSGDLLLIKNTKPDKLKSGDKIFLYNNLSATEFEVTLAEVRGVATSGTRTLITVDNDLQFDSQYLIGKQENTVAYHHLGTILSILESRWGYLFCIVIVTLLLLLQEIFDLIVELKYGTEEEKANSK